MNNHYDLLGIKQDASASQIKKAFRQKAKQLHPDIAGSSHSDAMRRLLSAYETLSNPERRYEYDRVYSRFFRKIGFDYRTWLSGRGDPQSQAKLVFFELLQLEEERAIEVWRKNGGLDFRMKKFMDREDWMDCLYILAEELDRREFSFEAFKLLAEIMAEEYRRPYFRHFAPEVEKYLNSLVKHRLKEQVDEETWICCMEIMADLENSRAEK